MTTSRKRVVIDTNVLISRLLARHSVPAQAVRRATGAAVVLVSNDFLLELSDVVWRRKFDRYLTKEIRRSFLSDLKETATLVATTTIVQACRDPKDNMILELALDGKADFIVTGDRDLLSMESFDGIAIRTPASYLSL